MVPPITTDGCSGILLHKGSMLNRIKCYLKYVVHKVPSFRPIPVIHFPDLLVKEFIFKSRLMFIVIVGQSYNHI